MSRWNNYNYSTKIFKTASNDATKNDNEKFNHLHPLNNLTPNPKKCNPTNPTKCESKKTKKTIRVNTKS